MAGITSTRRREKKEKETSSFFQEDSEDEGSSSLCQDLQRPEEEHSALKKWSGEEMDKRLIRPITNPTKIHPLDTKTREMKEKEKLIQRMEDARQKKKREGTTAPPVFYFGSVFDMVRPWLIRLGIVAIGIGIGFGVYKGAGWAKRNLWDSRKKTLLQEVEELPEFSPS
jgi:hypothetical protein